MEILSIMEDDSCPICFEPLEDAQTVKPSGCQHRFCFRCIDLWYDRNHTCPTCRTPMGSILDLAGVTVIQSFACDESQYDLGHVLMAMVTQMRGLYYAGAYRMDELLVAYVLRTLHADVVNAMIREGMVVTDETVRDTVQRVIQILGAFPAHTRDVYATLCVQALRPLLSSSTRSISVEPECVTIIVSGSPAVATAAVDGVRRPRNRSKRRRRVARVRAHAAAVAYSGSRAVGGRRVSGGPHARSAAAAAAVVARCLRTEGNAEGAWSITTIHSTPSTFAIATGAAAQHRGINTQTRIYTIFIKEHYVHLFVCVCVCVCVCTFPFTSSSTPPHYYHYHHHHRLPGNNYYYSANVHPPTHRRRAFSPFFVYTPAAACRTFVSVCVSAATAAAAATDDDDGHDDIDDYDDGAPEPLPPGFPSRIRAHDARALSSSFLSPRAGRRRFRRPSLPLARSRRFQRPSRSLSPALPCRTCVASAPVRASRAFAFLTGPKRPSYGFDSGRQSAEKRKTTDFGVLRCVSAIRVVDSFTYAAAAAAAGSPLPSDVCSRAARTSAAAAAAVITVVAALTTTARDTHRHYRHNRGHVLWADMLKDIHDPGLVADPEDGRNGACCAGCGRPIDDRFYLSAVDMCWHIGCLKCAECKLPLDAELTCYSRHGNIYCKQDYYRLFSIKRCARCQGGIGACDLVMRAKDLVYHVECFACYACGVTLCKGDYYGVRDGAVFCRPDYERIGRRDTCEPEPMCSPPRAAGHHWPSAHKGRPRKKRTAQLSPMMTAAERNGLAELNVLRIPQSTLEVMRATDLSSSMESLTYETSSLSSPTSSSTMGGAGGMSQQQQHQQQTRTKRMRTSFKHHQLRTMKSYFNINQNPDAKDLKQLAQKTGLSKRVLQVWFQNARAKWRRNIMRQENSQMVSGSMSSQNQNTPSDPDLIRGHTQVSQGLSFVDLF